MSQEKITIALIGEDRARIATKAMIADFVQLYDAMRKRKKTPTPEANSRYILQNFSFEGYQVDIVEVLLEDENPSRYDGIIWPVMQPGDLPPPRKPKEKPVKPKNLEEMVDETITALKIPIAEGEEWVVGRADTDPYFQLAVKIGGKGDRRQKIDLYETNADVKSKNILNEEERVALKTQSSMQKHQLIKDTLQEAIRVKEFLDSHQKSASKTGQKTTSLQTTTTTIKKKTTEQKISNPSWYQKSKWAFVGLVLSVMASIGLLTGLALTGFLLTPFIGLPIFFLTSAILVGIKIGYDNRSSQSAVTRSDADNPTNERFDNMPTYNRSDSQQVFKKVEKTDAWHESFRQLLFRYTAGGSQHMCIGENWDESLGLGPDNFRIPDTTLEKNKNDFLELLIEMKDTCNTLSVPICVENAPIIREMIAKNYSGEFLKDGKPTEFARKVQEALDGSLKSIPSDLLHPSYTKSLQKDTEQVTERSKGLRQ